jgi:hypothetical protein
MNLSRQNPIRLPIRFRYDAIRLAEKWLCHRGLARRQNDTPRGDSHNRRGEFFPPYGRIVSFVSLGIRISIRLHARTLIVLPTTATRLQAAYFSCRRCPCRGSFAPKLSLIGTVGLVVCVVFTSFMRFIFASIEGAYVDCRSHFNCLVPMSA